MSRQSIGLQPAEQVVKQSNFNRGMQFLSQTYLYGSDICMHLDPLKWYTSVA